MQLVLVLTQRKVEGQVPRPEPRHAAVGNYGSEFERRVKEEHDARQHR